MTEQIKAYAIYEIPSGQKTGEPHFDVRHSKLQQCSYSHLQRPFDKVPGKEYLRVEIDAAELLPFDLARDFRRILNHAHKKNDYDGIEFIYL